MPPQLHDLNPSLAPPLGLFWTIEVPMESVAVNLERGTASLQVTDAPILDYGTIEHALTGMGPPPVAGTVSFLVHWGGVTGRTTISNAAQGFGGDFVRTGAQMEWTATVGDYRFVSDPLGTSSAAFSEIGRERNGVFFRPGR